MTPAYPPPPSAWKRWFQLAAGGNQTSILIAGVTVIWTRQKATGTGVIKPGGVKLSAAMGVAAMEITSGKTRLESLVQLSAAAGAAKTAVDAVSAAAKPQTESPARSMTRFTVCPSLNDVALYGSSRRWRGHRRRACLASAAGSGRA